MPTITGRVTDAVGAGIVGAVVRAYDLAAGALAGSGTTTDGTESGGDPHFDKVSLLVRGDETSGSTTFADSGPLALSLTRTGSLVTSSSSVKFSNNVYASSTGRYLNVPATPGTEFGTGDFTIESWVRRERNAATTSIWTASNAGVSKMGLENNTTSGMVFYDYENSVTISFSEYVLPLNTWVHLALVRISGVLTLYADGVSKGGDAYTASCPAGCIWQWFKGYLEVGTTYDMFGRLDDIRITKGVARYTSSFTAPTAQFPDFAAEAGNYTITVPTAEEHYCVVLSPDTPTVENHRILRVEVT